MYKVSYIDSKGNDRSTPYMRLPSAVLEAFRLNLLYFPHVRISK